MDIGEDVTGMTIQTNTIAGNGANGVKVGPTSTQNSILGNRIRNNGQIGIDLLAAGATSSDGVTPNDDDDSDDGGNGLQNFPELTSATASGGTLTVTGTLTSTPSTTFRVEFFSNDALDPSGFGEGEAFLGFEEVTTDANGDAPFSVPISAAVDDGDSITATATDPDGNTSEFSAGAEVNADGGNLPPIITSLSGDTMGEEGDLFNFTASATDPDEGDELTYTWNYGDGSPEASGVDLTEVSHIYDTAGTYTLTLTVDDGNGGEDTETLEATVDESDPGNQPPVITSLTGDTQGDEGDLFEFMAAANDPDGDPLTYTWNYGDGTPEASGVDLTEVSHVYDTAGTYTLTLTVTDGNGGEDTAMLTVVVDEPSTGTPDLVITVEAVSPPVVIPDGGGSFQYRATLTNNEATAQTVDAWLIATTPTGQMVRVRPSKTVTVQPGQTLMVTLRRSVPANAPPGTYVITARVGDESAGVVFDSDAFTIEKAASASGVSSKLGASELAGIAALVTFGDDAFAEPLPLPEALSLLQARPNPFASATTLAYELPESGAVRLAVYDARGREVIVLVDRAQEGADTRPASTPATSRAGSTSTASRPPLAWRRGG